MARLNLDPRFDDLDAEIDDEEDAYVPPKAKFPSKDEEDVEDERLPQLEEEQEE